MVGVFFVPVDFLIAAAVVGPLDQDDGVVDVNFQVSVFFRPQTVEVGHLAGVAAGNGSRNLDLAGGCGLQAGQVGDVLVYLHMGYDGLAFCPVLHIVGGGQHQAVCPDEIEPVVILPPDGLAPGLRGLE